MHLGSYLKLMVFIVGGSCFRRTFYGLNRSKFPLNLLNNICDIQRDYVPRSSFVAYMSSSNATENDRLAKKKILLKSLIKKRAPEKSILVESSAISSPQLNSNVNILI